jgi:tripartite-type tricarboxylate transporter receptor subunit TctC
MNEAGVAGYESGSWLGLVAPAKTPRPIIKRLNEAMVKAVANPDTRARIEALGAEPAGTSPEQFAAMLRRESALHAKIVKLAGVKVD